VVEEIFVEEDESRLALIPKCRMGRGGKKEGKKF